MADIKQAAKWMQEGKRVLRRAQPHRVTVPVKDEQGLWAHFLNSDGGETNWGVLELLADDWEVVG